jgi:hypothetical protein
MFHRNGVVLSAISIALLSLGWTTSVSAGGLQEDAKPQEDRSATSLSDAIAGLQAQLRQQQAQIDRLTAMLAAQQELLNSRGLPAGGGDQPVSGSVTPVDTTASPQGQALAATEEALKQYATRVDKLGKQLETTSANLGGFKFSGDFRLRFDGQWRAGNDVAGPVRNTRARYRLRMNVDKELDSMFKFHEMLSTGPFNNGLTYDSDMSGTVARPPLSLAEAWMDFHPSKYLSLRGGRMEEVFADNMRFLWDDDVRFNGFQQIVTIPFDRGWAGFESLEFRGGEYFLDNPNIVILSSDSPFVTATLRWVQAYRRPTCSIQVSS